MTDEPRISAAGVIRVTLNRSILVQEIGADRDGARRPYVVISVAGGQGARLYVGDMVALDVVNLRIHGDAE